MKTDLMCGVLKLSQSPKLFSGNLFRYKIIYIIPNRIVCHRSFHNIVSMGFSTTTSGNKI